MATRDDLLAVAAKLAADARESPAAGQARFCVDGAKTALEAAALASNTTASEIDQALADIRDLLEQAGVAELADSMDPTAFLQASYRAMIVWRQTATEAESYEIAYDGLREVLCNLLSDFTAGGTETSMRIAGRIQNALDDATATINRARQGVSDGSSQDDAEA